MSQRQQLARILTIDRKIRAGKFPSPDELAQEMEVKRRTIFNDRKFMVERLLAPLAFDRERGGWYYTDTNWSLPSTMVTEGELLAFCLSVELARRYAGTGLDGPLTSAIEKIASTLHAPVTVDLQSLRAHCSFASPPAVATDEKTLMAVHRAIGDQCSLRLHYHTAERDTLTRRMVDPHLLHHAQGNWYLIAFDHQSAEMRTFHLGRIKSWERLSGRFVPQEDFDPQEWVRGLFAAESGWRVMNVAVRFDAYQATFIRERVWHETQQIEELPDGDIIVRFQTSSRGEVTRWILQYGSHAEVLEPEDLRDEIAEETYAMWQRYRSQRRAR